MAKILNLDKLVETQRGNQRLLTINGVPYPIQDMSVDNFIQTTLDAERVAKDDSLAEQIKATADMICRSVPSLPRDVLGKYTLPVLSTIVQFVRGDEVDEAEEQAVAAAVEAGN